MPEMVWNGETDDDPQAYWDTYCFDHYYAQLAPGDHPSLEGILAFLSNALEEGTLQMDAVVEAITTMVSLWTGAKWTRPQW
jgi:hypothetical protein